jgi:hypothetical protein
MIEPLPSQWPKVLAFRLSGKLHHEDYQHFVPTVEAAVKQHGKIRILSQFHDFHGWDLHAVWDDTVFSTKECHHIERIAMVGDAKWEEWMARFCQPFTKGTIRYFDVAKIDEARAWVSEGL